MKNLQPELLHRMDLAFPNAGGFARLMEAREEWVKEIPAGMSDPSPGTNFHPAEMEQLNRIFEFLKGDEPARSTLANWLVFAQLKNDCAGF